MGSLAVLVACSGKPAASPGADRDAAAPAAETASPTQAPEAAAPRPPPATVEGLHLEARWLLASDAASGERLDRAERLLGEVLAGDPGNAEALIDLARVSFRRAQVARPETAGEEVKRADAALDRALALDPGSFAARIQRGRLRLFEGDVAAAAVALEQAEAVHPGAAEGLVLRARIAERSGDLEAAIEAAWAAIRVSGDRLVRAEAHAVLCPSLLALKRDAEADLAFRSAIDNDPAGTRVKTEYSRFLSRAERWDEAMKYAEEALVQTDDDAAHRALAEACFGRGKVLYWQERRFIEAGRDFQCAIRHRPDHADAFYLLGLALREVARETRDRVLVERAREALGRAVALDPKHADAARELAALPAADRPPEARGAEKRKGREKRRDRRGSGKRR